MNRDFDSCYRAVRSRDSRFDGWFFVGVTSTGIYCRPSCPAITPKKANARFYRTAAAAQANGFRACKRCRPDAVPGSPEWDARADVVGRAMRLISDGMIDREGVAGLAHKLAYTERHLNRLLVTEVGAGPLALARARRAHTARLLIETTKLPISEIAFAAGFSSIRQFNETVREVFATTPRELRKSQGKSIETTPGEISLRLPYREPFAADALFGFLAARAVPGVEEFVDGTYRRTLRLPHGAGIVTLSDGEGHIRCGLCLEDMRDLGVAVQRCRRLLDLDADPVSVDAHLGEDSMLAPFVREHPGTRVPGSVDGAETAVRAILGQQISVAGARTLAARLVANHGSELPETLATDSLTHLFPEPATLARAALDDVRLPGARREALRSLARSISDGEVALDSGVDRLDTEQRLLEVPGIGPWTASYIAMRALGDPDAFLAADLGVRHAISRLGYDGEIEALAERWRPWRAYAVQHLWASLEDEKSERPSKKREVKA